MIEIIRLLAGGMFFWSFIMGGAATGALIDIMIQKLRK
jgi:hypothetical protein